MLNDAILTPTGWRLRTPPTDGASDAPSSPVPDDLWSPPEVVTTADRPHEPPVNHFGGDTVLPPPARVDLDTTRRLPVIGRADLDHASLTPSPFEPSPFEPSPFDLDSGPVMPSPKRPDLDPLEGFVFPKRKRRVPVLPLALVALVGAIGFAAWSVTHRAGVAVADIRPANCLILPTNVAGLPGTQLTRFTRVGCDAPHNAEVFATKVMDTAAAFPGEDALSQTATATCQTAVPPVIRTHSESATWSIIFFAPVSATTYHQGQAATLLCIVSFPNDRTLPLLG
jgi:hypothetical protein